ncbi:hypothetical protein JCM11251_006926 [Rhodosporidiobolus azoricus]
MSISAHLPCAALSSEPLLVSFSLDQFRAPPGRSSTTSSDPFEVLDEGAGAWDADYSVLGEDGAPEERERGPAELPTPTPPRTSLSSALSDSAGVLFPHLSLADEAQLAHLQDATAGAEADLPAWLKETSGRITTINSTRVRSAGRKKSDGSEGRRRSPGTDHLNRGGSDARVVVGCEDGTVWVFAPLEPSCPQQEPSTSMQHFYARTSDSLSPRRLSHESVSAPTSAASSTPSSPPTSPSAGSRHKFSSISPSSPRLTARRSSSSLSTLVSNATTRNQRISSSSSSFKHPSSHSGQSTASAASYDIVRSVSRPRKASATVSISTSSALPSSSHSNESSIPDLSALPTSPNPTSPRTSTSPPLSPTIPHLVFSSPSPTPSQNPLGSRKEGARTPRSDIEAGIPDGPTSISLQKRSHSRAKHSIASGIGLWELDGAASSRSSLASPTEERGSMDVGTAVGMVEEQVEAGVEALPDELLPILQIRTAGWGEVVALEVVEGLECVSADEGVALVVLRQSGALSVISLVDGRAFGTCDTGANVPSSSGSGGPVFFGLQLATIADTVFAICISATTAVPVHLGSLEVQTGLVGDFGSAGPLAVRCEGVTYLVHSSSSASAGGPPPFFVTRIVAHDTGPSATPVLSLDEPRNVGVLPSLKGSLKWLRRAGEKYIGSDGSTVELFSLRDFRVVALARFEAKVPVEGLTFESEGRYCVLAHKEASSVLTIEIGADQAISLEPSKHIPFATESIAFFSTPYSPSVLFSRAISPGQRCLSLLRLDTLCDSMAAEGPPQQLYRSTPRREAQVTSVKVIGCDRVLFGYSSGAIALVNIASVATSADPPPAKGELVGAITLLDTLELGGRQVVIAGSSSGMAGAWNLSDFDLLGCWTLFASSVKSFAYIDPSPTSTSKLGNTIAFVSANSPVALVSLFPPELLFVLPGTKSGVELIATTKNDIMVLYEQGLARTCDIASRELRRSMDRRTAEKTLKEDDWTVWFRLDEERSSALPALSGADPLFQLDLRKFLDDAALRLPWTDSHSAKKRDSPLNGTPTASPDPNASQRETHLLSQLDERGVARQLIAAVATFGLDSSADELLQQLDITPPAVSLSSVLASEQGVSAYNSSLPAFAWTMSAVITARSLLQLVCLLRVFLNYPETERSANQAIVYYASCLNDAIGPDFVPPSLEIFARFWLDRNVEVQQAARTLFGTYLVAMPDDDAVAFVERWQESLPARSSSIGVLHHQADHALLVVGLVATERYKLLSSSVLKDLAVSISTYLDDHQHPFHQAVATELCSRGFGIWQNYVDAVSLVRQLFAIAIGRNAATPNDLRLLARNATLHVATVNTSLFMTTLVHDIVNTSSATARNATLKLLGFIIRKKPLVLYTSLPRVAEAVVKSLDPTVSTLRETVHQAATVILNELVKTFPSIDFHGKSQRLAVGTQEGAAIVFDLRTATRLYVLEGHSRAVTALSWSPDGHRLVTVSLEESRVAAWKVGVGLLSMFMPGAPPRQGPGSSTAPFKIYDFHVGDEALMTTAATLEWVVFDWPAERTVRLRLRETALNFGV